MPIMYGISEISKLSCVSILDLEMAVFNGMNIVKPLYSNIWLLLPKFITVTSIFYCDNQVYTLTLY